MSSTSFRLASTGPASVEEAQQGPTTAARRDHDRSLVRRPGVLCDGLALGTARSRYGRAAPRVDAPEGGLVGVEGNSPF
jgi:hypothetical protein